MKKNPHTNRFNSIKGVISDKEINFIKNLLPGNNKFKNFKGAISDKELKWLKKLIPNN
jgi:hypothetical protein